MPRSGQEAVQYHRVRAEDDPVDGRTELAQSLRSLAEQQAALGRAGEALSLARESVEHLREVAKELPNVLIDAELAESLSTPEHPPARAGLASCCATCRRSTRSAAASPLPCYESRGGSGTRS